MRKKERKKSKIISHKKEKSKKNIETNQSQHFLYPMNPLTPRKRKGSPGIGRVDFSGPNQNSKERKKT